MTAKVDSQATERMQQPEYSVPISITSSSSASLGIHHLESAVGDTINADPSQSLTDAKAEQKECKGSDTEPQDPFVRQLQVRHLIKPNHPSHRLEACARFRPLVGFSLQILLKFCCRACFSVALKPQSECRAMVSP
jgi:hypothetical protein